MNLIQLSNKVAGLAQQFQNLILLGKRFEEFPLKENVNPLSRMLVSTNGTTEALQLKTLLDAVSNETQNNKVREGILGTITPEYTLENILDNTGLLVEPDEIVILSVFEAIDSSSEIQQFKQRLFLWKLGKGNFGPIGSDNIDSKLFELPSIFPSEETADEIIGAPNAIVRDYGTVSTDILTTINTKSPAVSFNEISEDVTFIYYVRVTIEGVKYLYQFKGLNGIYGQGAAQMVNDDLVLIYSSSNSGPVNNYAYVTKSSLGETVINTVANNVILPENGKSIYNITATGNQVVIGKNKNYLGEATSETVPLGMVLKVINSSNSGLNFLHNFNDPNIKPVITPDGQTFVAAPGSVVSLLERENSILLVSYSLVGGSVTQNYVDGKDLETLEAAQDYTNEVFDSLTTTDVTEGNRLYHTSSRVLGTILNTINFAVTGTILETDSIVNALAKIKNSIDSLTTAVSLRELSSNKKNTGAMSNSATDFPTENKVKTFFESATARKHSFMFYTNGTLTADGKKHYQVQNQATSSPYSPLALLFGVGADVNNMVDWSDRAVGYNFPFKCKITDVTIRVSKGEYPALSLKFACFTQNAYTNIHNNQLICDEAIESPANGVGTGSSELTKSMTILTHTELPAYSCFRFAVGSNNGVAQPLNRWFKVIVTVTEIT